MAPRKTNGGLASRRDTVVRLSSTSPAISAAAHSETTSMRPCRKSEGVPCAQCDRPISPTSPPTVSQTGSAGLAANCGERPGVLQRRAVAALRKVVGALRRPSPVRGPQRGTEGIAAKLLGRLRWEHTAACNDDGDHDERRWQQPPSPPRPEGGQVGLAG